MDSDILNIEEIVLGRGLPDPPPEAPPEKPAEPYKPVILNGPPAPSVQSYQHENLQCFQCFITFCNAKAKERHMKKSHREEYKQQLQQLTSHRRQVCPEKLLVCKDCSQTFRSPGLLRAHRLTQHPRPDESAEQPEDPSKPHRCKKCGQGFEAESDLQAHQEKYPEGQQCNGSASPVKKRGRPAKAEEPAGSEKKAKRKKKDEEEISEESTKASSTVESAVAPGEDKGKAGGAKRGRPSKAASETEDKKGSEDDSQAPAKEKKPKEDPAPPRQIPCTECDLTFPGLVQLRAHKKEKHTPRKAHPCEECEESFARPEQLEAHMSRAHAVGRLSCPTCGKSFSRERTLQAHLKSHPEEKPENPEKSGANR
ncbi:hypothetical protein XENOCAPTIV_010745, partial [Xenoophorus captivus]